MRRKWGRVARSMVIPLIVACLLSGCQVNYKKDYLHKYRQYLTYALGDYEVVEAKTEHYTSTPVPVAGTYRSWTLAYQKKAGEVKHFSFDNRVHGETGDDGNFGYAVMNEAFVDTLERIENEIINKHFPPDEQAAADEASAYVFVSADDKKVNYSTFIKAGTGINLRSVSAKKLINDFGCNYEFMLTTSGEDLEDIPEIKGKFERMLLEVFQYLENEEPVCTINTSSGSYLGEYDSKAGCFTWHLLRK